MSVPTIDQPTPQQTVKIPKEHLPTVINSLLIERLMEFERRLNTETGLHEWRGIKADGTEVDWTDEPPFDFANDVSLALALAERLCLEEDLTLDMQFSKDTGAYALKWGQRVDAENAKLVGLPVLGKPLAVALCMSICALRELDVPGQHRALFPGHYMQLS